MAFLDDIGKKIGMAGQTAAQKAMVMTDVARINADIAEEEKKMDNNFLQIGKLYISLHAEDWEKEFDGMVAAIRESELRIKGYRERIQSIKGVVRCERCGAEVANTAAFCNSCGAAMPRRIQAASQEQVRTCSKCGARIDDDNRFCTVCGTPVTMTQQVEERPAVQRTETRPLVRYTEIEQPMAQRMEEQPMVRSRMYDDETQMLMTEGQSGPTGQLEQSVATEQSEQRVAAGQLGQNAAMEQWGQNMTTESWIQQTPEMPGHADTMQACANCHAYVEPDMLFCTECGQKLK